MYEIEVKLLDINPEMVVQNLISLGAKKTFDDEILAIYFDSADKSITKNKDTVRLRKEGKKTVLTFKKYISNAEMKVREEQEVEVSDFNAMSEILRSLGLSPWLEMEKHRVTYELDNTHFEIDKYHGTYEFIPAFLEIEAADAAVVYKYAELLGFRKEDCRPWDALQVAQYYLRD